MGAGRGSPARVRVGSVPPAAVLREALASGAADEGGAWPQPVARRTAKARVAALARRGALNCSFPSMPRGRPRRSLCNHYGRADARGKGGKGAAS